MWLLSLFTDSLMQFIIVAIYLVGMIGYLLASFGGVIPVLKPHTDTVKILSITVMLVGVYLYGGYSTEMTWRDRVAQLEVKNKVAEEKFNTTNKVIEERIVYKTIIVKEKAKNIIDKTNNPVIVNYDKNCPLPKEVIDIHNEAVNMNLIIKNKEAK